MIPSRNLPIILSEKVASAATFPCNMNNITISEPEITYSSFCQSEWLKFITEDLLDEKVPKNIGNITDINIGSGFHETSQFILNKLSEVLNLLNRERPETHNETESGLPLHLSDVCGKIDTIVEQDQIS